MAQAFKRDYIWSAVEFFGTTFFTVISSMILARLINPEYFGLFALIVSVSNFSKIFLDSGYSQAIIRSGKLKLSQTNGVVVFNLVMASIINIVIAFLELEDLSPYKVYIYAIIYLEAICVTPISILQRKKKFRELAISSICANIISGFAAIYIAFYITNDVRVLVIKSILFLFVYSILLHVFNRSKIKFQISTEFLKNKFPFTIPLLMSGLTTKGSKSISTFIIDGYFGSQFLGLFNRSGAIKDNFSLGFSRIVQKVAYPHLTNLQGGVKVSYYKKVDIQLSFLLLSLPFFGIFFSRTIVLIFLGENWLQAIPLVRIFFLVGWFYPLKMLFYNLLKSEGMTTEIFKAETIKSIVLLFSILSVSKIGNSSYLVWVYFIVEFIGFLYDTWLGKKKLNIRVNTRIYFSLAMALLAFLLCVV